MGWPNISNGYGSFSKTWYFCSGSNLQLAGVKEQNTSVEPGWWFKILIVVGV
jgi:hypothetical protein